MRRVREQMANTESGRIVTTELPQKFGTLRQTYMRPHACALIEQLPPRNSIDNRSRLDTEVFVPLARIVAQNAREYFKCRLLALFPGTRIISDITDMSPKDRYTFLIPPIKGQARVGVKVNEYRDEHGNNESSWPFVSYVGDMLRASIVCVDGDGVYNAWKRIASPAGFDVREGRGRLSACRLS